VTLPEKITAADDDDGAGARREESPAAAAPVAAASVIGVSKSFKGVCVLEEVSFDVGEGEALVLLGASGSGKTTLLRIIAGLEQPDAGRVRLHGRDVTELPSSSSPTRSSRA
jgi:ABC-type Fe3+/spermidine/putrescine transport system ATPase subunit